MKFFRSSSVCGRSCAGNCKTCSIASTGLTSCVACVNPYDFLSGLSCVSKCPEGMFGDPSSGKCVKVCPRMYSTMDRTNHLCVTECPIESFQLNAGTHLECLLACPKNFYPAIDELNNRICSSCHLTCGICASPAPTDCLSCSDPTSLYLHIHEFYHKCSSPCE